MKKIFKRGMSGLLAVLMAFTVLAGLGTTTAFAASETAESYMISFPRDGDAAQIYSEDAWGHSAKTYMNGWTTGSSNYTTLHCMDSFDGKVCYCIEPGLSRNVGDTYHGFGEDFWDNYPSQYNNTIEPDDIKLLLGRIMQYGYLETVARTNLFAIDGAAIEAGDKLLTLSTCCTLYGKNETGDQRLVVAAKLLPTAEEEAPYAVQDAKFPELPENK